MELFGLKLKALRQGKHLTQEQLANKIDIVKASVSGYEKNAIFPSVEVLIKICRYFGVSADYLLGLSDAMDFNVAHLTDEQVSLITGVVLQFEQLNNAKS